MTTAVSVVVCVALGVSVMFLGERADMYVQTRHAAQGLLESTPSWREGDRTLAVNFPGWIAPKRQTFALGHEGVSFIPDYSSIMDLVWTMTGSERFIGSYVVRELQAHWRHNFRNYGPAISLAELQPQLRGVQRVLFTSNRRDNLATYDVGSLEAVNQTSPREYVSSFNDEIVLISGTWRQVNDTLEVTLYWHCQRPPAQDLRTYVHLQALDNALVAQEDGSPLMGLSSPLWWKAGDQWRDLRVIVLPDNLKSGRYVLRVGVYPTSGDERLPAMNSTGVRYENDSAILGEFVLP